MFKDELLKMCTSNNYNKNMNSEMYKDVTKHNEITCLVAVNVLFMCSQCRKLDTQQWKSNCLTLVHKKK